MSVSLVSVPYTPAVPYVLRSVGQVPGASVQNFGRAPEAAVNCVLANLGALAAPHGGLLSVTAPPALLGTHASVADARANAFALLAQVQTLAAKEGDDALYTRMKLFVAASEAQQARYNVLGAALDQVKAAHESAVDLAIGAADETAAAAANVEAARDEVTRREAELSAATPGTPEYAELEATVAAAMSGLALGENALAASAAVLLAANTLAMAKGDELEAVVSELEAIINTATRGIATAYGTTHEARLTALIAAVSSLLADAAMEGLAEDLEIQKLRLEIQSLDNQRRIKELEEQNRKAAEAQGKAASLSKTLGWIVTAVAVVTAPLTGGLSMALAAISLGMMINMQVTGNDIIGNALSPLINSVFAGLTAAITKAAVGIFGEDIGRVVGAVLSAAIIVASMIVVAVVAKAAVSKLMPNIVKELTRTVSKQWGKVLVQAGISAERQVALASYAGVVAVAGNLVQAGVNTGATAYVNVLRIDEAKKASALENAILQSDLIREMRAELYEKLREAMEYVDQLVAVLLEALAHRGEGNAAISRHFRGAV